MDQAEVEEPRRGSSERRTVSDMDARKKRKAIVQRGTEKEGWKFPTRVGKRGK